MDDLEKRLSEIDAKLKMELGDDAATGNVWRVVDSYGDRLKVIEEMIWKGNGKDSIITQVVRLRTEIRTIAVLLGILVPVGIKVIDILWSHHAPGG